MAKKVLLLGNGFNLSLSNKSIYKNLLVKHLELFYETFNFEKIYIDKYGIGTSKYAHTEQSNEKTYLNEFDAKATFESFLKKLKIPSPTKLAEKKIFNYYKKVNDKNIHNDLESIAQLFRSSKNFEKNLTENRNKFNEFKNFVRKDISNNLKLNKNLINIDKEFVDKINNEYDLVLTTNYDHNLEKNGIKNVIHLHGSYNDLESMELVTFKSTEAISNIIANEEAFKEKVAIDIYGISLFNEIHILNVFLSLFYNGKIINFNQYIFNDDEKDFEDQKVGRYLVLYFFEKDLNASLSFPERESGWTLELIDQVNDRSKENTYIPIEISNVLSPKISREKFEVFWSFIKSFNYLDTSDHIIFNDENDTVPSIDITSLK